MSDPPPARDTSPIGAHQIAEDGRIQSIYWQSGYQLGRDDQRITDLQQTRAWLSELHDDATDAGYDARQHHLDQLQADLLEAESARASHLEKLDELIEEWEVHRVAANADPADDIFEPGNPTATGDQPSAGKAPNQTSSTGVVRTPRAPDSPRQAYRSQGQVSTFQPRR